MKISEIFSAIQGEGTLCGTPQVFIRTQGCNLACEGCDSKYTWDKDGGVEMSVNEIIERVKEYGIKSVCLTGGEPSLQNDAAELCSELRQLGYYVSLQTNGTIWTKLHLVCNKICMDMKPGISDVFLIKRLVPNDEVKILVGCEEDLVYAREINNLASETKVMTIIQIENDVGKDTTADLVEKYRRVVEAILQNPLREPYRILPQLHTLIWGNERMR